MQCNVNFISLMFKVYDLINASKQRDLAIVSDSVTRTLCGDFRSREQFSQSVFKTHRRFTQETDEFDGHTVD